MIKKITFLFFLSLAGCLTKNQLHAHSSTQTTRNVPNVAINHLPIEILSNHTIQENTTAADVLTTIGQDTHSYTLASDSDNEENDLFTDSPADISSTQMVSNFKNPLDISNDVKDNAYNIHIRNDKDDNTNIHDKYAIVLNATPRISYAGNYDISNVIFNEVVLSVGGQEVLPHAMLFNGDGTRLYVMGQIGDDINQYDLTTPYDISTATFSQIALYIGTEEGSSTSMLFNHDGTHLYVMGTVGDDINQYDLTTPYDISTATFTQVLDLAAQETNPTAMLFNGNGTRLYVMGQTGDDINQYDLTTPYDISTATFSQIALDVATQETDPTAMLFNGDGKRLYVMGTSGDDINQYDLSTPYDISTAIFNQIALDLVAQELSPTAMLFDGDGTHLYTIGTSSRNINQYNLNPVSFTETVSNIGVVESSVNIDVQLFQEEFTGNNGDDFIADGKATIANVPAGLTAVLTQISPSTLRLTFTGQATDHDDMHDLASLEFTFVDNAFVSTVASGILNAVSASSGIPINFNDNHAPTALSLNKHMILENTTAVGVFKTIDTDTGDTHSYTLVSGAGAEDNGLFTLSTSGMLSFQVAPDFDNPTDIGDTPSNNTYSIRVQTNDGNGGTFVENFIIRIIELNEPQISYVGNFSVSNVTFNQVALSVAIQDRTPSDMLFNGDGTRLYVMGSDGADINQYDLTTPYDISTGIFNQIALDVAIQENDPTAMLFNGDGTRLYVVGTSGDDINQYDLIIPYDISTAIFNQIALSVAAQESLPFAMLFNGDGTRLYVMGSDGDDINQYDLSVPYDIATATFNQIALSVAAQESSPRDILFNGDGTRLYVMGFAGDDINQYDLSTPYEISTATFDQIALSVAVQEINPSAMLFNDDGTRLYVMGLFGDDINQYNLSPVVSFTETVANNGAVESSVDVQLLQEEFTGNNGDDFIADGKATISNVPAGLTAVLTRTTPSTLRLTFTGQATNHEDMDDLLSLEFTFMDNAFVSTSASGVLNAVSASSGIAIDFNDNNPPTALSLSNDRIQENITVVGAFTTTDQDTGDTHSYTLVPGTGAEDNGLFALSVDGMLSFQAAPDFDNPMDMGDTPSNNTYSIRVQTNDGNGGIFEETFIIQVTDPNPQISYAGNFDISSVTFDQIALPVSGQESNPSTMLFNADGTRLYVMGFAGDDINQYDLSTPYDISTASFTQIALPVATQETNPYAMLFNDNGSRLYVMGVSGDDINQYDLTTPYDISTATFTQIALSVAAQESNPRDMQFNGDGTRLYVMGTSGDDINQYDLSTPYDISTATFNQIALSVRSEESNPYAMLFNGNGTRLYVMGLTGDDINQYNLSTPYDISTATFDQIALSVAAQESSPRAMLFNGNGTRLYVMGTSGDDINQYNLNPVVSFTETVTNNGTVEISASVQLSQEEFTGNNGNDFIADGKATISNVPAGLTAVLTRINLFELSLTFTGQAINHDDMDDLASLEFTFMDNAFVSASASDVLNAVSVSSGIAIDFNDNNPPTGLTLSNQTIPENATVVGAFTAIDPDTGDTQSYTLVSGTGAEDNGLFTLSVDGVLSFGTAPDFENPTDIGDTPSNNTYSIRVQTDDGNGETFEEMFIIQIVDLDENPRISYAGNFDISNFTFDKIALSVGAQETNPTTMLFNGNGTQLYVMGTSGDDINQYDLSIPYDISTATFNQIALSVAVQETSPQNMLFNTDGTRLYVIGTSGDDINQYDLQLPYDISTATFTQIALDVSAQELSPTAMLFNGDGSRLYIMGTDGTDINQYDLSIPYDIGTATFAQVVLLVSTQEGEPQNMLFNTDGTRLYLVGSNTNNINQYNLGTRYDISTATFAQVAISVRDQELNTHNLHFNAEGSLLFVMGISGDDINQYNLSRSPSFHRNRDQHWSGGIFR